MKKNIFKKKICVVTGSRAEYGLLKPLMEKILLDKEFELQIIVTAMHLSHEFGQTYQEIENDGFTITEKVEVLLSSDSSTAVSKAIGLGCISFSETFVRLQPNIVVLLGDRFETFAAAVVAHVARIPIAHLHGGELTEGAIDDAFRHSITKMSAIHFVSTDMYRRRVMQLGEESIKVFNVGAIGLDNIKMMKFLTKIELENNLGLKFLKRNILVTFHPATSDRHSVVQQCEELLAALTERMDTLKIFTKSNADVGGRLINTLIEKFVQHHPENSVVFSSLGQLRYLSLLQFVDCVVGNSSSGLIEVPSFHKGTINIGSRQDGRIKGKSVIDCRAEKDAIKKAFDVLYSEKFQHQLKTNNNPYGDGKTAVKILTILKKINYRSINKKHFVDFNSDRIPLN